MRIYLIAPMPTGGHDLLVSDKVLNVDERYATIAAAGIVTVAAYFDEGFDIRLCDELIEDVDFDDPSDVIGISMNVAQVSRGMEIARRFRAMGRTVIMGGAHVSLAPDVFHGEADCLVVGEFEAIGPEVVADLREGRLKPRYDGPKADLSQTRIPRWDLYRNERAVAGVVQTSRGCPFECNFCDVIQYLGRVQRHKPPERVIDELQVLHGLGYRYVQLSDDNFTVYRRRTRALLEALAAWNGREGREPVQFVTQASVDIARDDGLLDLCNEAGVRDIFIGIETSSEEALKESKKRQNLHQDLVQQCTKVVSAGVSVTSGMMVGFDSDDLGCFERQFKFGMSLPVVMLRVTVLVAPLATPLYAQLKADGRLVSEATDEWRQGSALWTNFVPCNMTRQQLAEGAIWLVESLMEPDNVIRRFQQFAAVLKAAPDHLRRHGRSTFTTSGASAMLQILRKGAKDVGGRRVIEAVDALARERREIAQDLTAALATYLNTHISLQRLKRDRSGSAPLRADHGQALG
jgi:hypothetical protein